MLRWVSRRHALFITLAGSALACAGGKETTPETHVYVDAAGRGCEATLEKTSSSAPSVSESVTCDSGERDCSTEASPCFELSVTPDTYAVTNCPACCRGSASSYSAADCSAVTCEADTDCIFQKAICSDGACVCPNGVCE
jgi:hypothetical protein